jgi:hypothetical protein
MSDKVCFFKDKNIFCRTEGTAFQLFCLVERKSAKTGYYIVFMSMPSVVPYSRSVLLTGGRGGNLSSSKGLFNLVKGLKFLKKKKHVRCRNYLRHELLWFLNPRKKHDTCEPYFAKR